MKKKLLKQIRQVANELPEMTYTAFPKEYVYQKEEHGFDDTKKPKVLTSKRVPVKVNHYRRLKRLVEKAGFDEGAKRYLRAIKMGVK